MKNVEATGRNLSKDEEARAWDRSIRQHVLKYINYLYTYAGVRDKQRRDPMCPRCGSNIAGEPGHACSIKMPCGWCGEDSKTGRLVRWSGRDGPLRIPRLSLLKGRCDAECSAPCPRTDPKWCSLDHFLLRLDRWWFGCLEAGAMEVVPPGGADRMRAILADMEGLLGLWAR